MSTQTERAPLAPLDREEYPLGSSVRVADMEPIERAWAEAEHEGCDETPPHPLSAHEPWSGGDLDGVETWPSFVARLARHGLRLSLVSEMALRPWLRHKTWCNVKTDDPPETERCKCGLAAALRIR